MYLTKQALFYILMDSKSTENFRGILDSRVYNRVDKVKGGGLTGEKDFIERLKQGDPAWAEILMQQYKPLLTYLISPILSDERDREDCLSEVIVKVLEKIGQYDPEKASFTTWLTAVTRNAALNKLRQTRNRREEAMDEQMPSQGLTPEETLLREERKKALENALYQLPRKDKLLFYRKYYYCQSTAQIAAELGLSQRAVEGRLYRIKKHLRELLGGEGYV